MFLGTVKLAGNLTFYTTTHTLATGAAVDADAVPGYRVYEDETGTPLLTGSMALLDDANTTGFYSEQIAVTVANGFEVGKDYCIRITKVIGGVTSTEAQTFAVDSKRVSDLNDLAAGAAMTWTVSAAAMTASLTGATITIHRGDVLTVAFTGLGNVSTKTKSWIAIKNSKDDLDAASYLFCEETAGLTIVNGVAYTPITDASLVWTNTTTGAATFTIKAAVTVNFTKANTRYYEIQVLETAGPRTVTEGQCLVTYDVVRTIT
jgi:hypothetical protein